MALATVEHHSYGPTANAAPRGQTTGTSAGEVHAGLRAQMAPPPGRRPGILAEPGPQRSDRSERHFSGNSLPIPGLPVLAGASGEAVDTSALRILAAAALEDLRKLEEVHKKKQELAEKDKEKAKAAEEEETKMRKINDKVRRDLPLTPEEWAAWYRWNGIAPQPSSSSSSEKRRKKRKKRRKRTRRSRSCCTPCTLSCRRSRSRLWRRLSELPLRFSYASSYKSLSHPTSCSTCL